MSEDTLIKAERFLNYLFDTIEEKRSGEQFLFDMVQEIKKQEEGFQKDIIKALGIWLYSEDEDKAIAAPRLMLLLSAVEYIPDLEKICDAIKGGKKYPAVNTTYIRSLESLRKTRDMMQGQ